MRPASPLPFILSPVARAVSWVVLGAFCGGAGLAHGQTQAAPASLATPSTSPVAESTAGQVVGEGLKLKSTPMLAEEVSSRPEDKGPTFVFGDRVTGRPDLDTLIDGNAELRRGATSIRADRIEYYQPDDQVKSRGNVRINRAGNRFDGPELEIKLDRFEGFFTSPGYRFLSNGGNGRAERIDFLDDKHLTARKASYTTCERNNEATWEPSWVLTADSFEFDLETDVGVAKNAVIRFKKVPILAFPSVSFPLSDKRKSGLLPPTIATSSVSGFEYRQPYYFDIAPNRDATLSPAYISKRGVDLAGEFRYLEPGYSGTLRANILPGDKLRNRDRWSYSLQHTGPINTGIASVGAVGLSMNLNRVSDNDYWRDFQTPGAATSQRLLPNDVILSWGRGFFGTTLRTIKWQTLQDVTSPITPPYDILPQITANYTRVDAPLLGVGRGFDWYVLGELTRFSADRSLTRQPNANRAVTRFVASYPMLGVAGYVTPKIQLHATNYQFDSTLANGSTSASRVVPTFSLDSGLQFERSTDYFGRSFTQTLEPRAFYVRTPFRDQSNLPNYDSGLTDFNFATVFTENAFGGNDRIADANLLTLGVTSRLLEPSTGAEVVRVGVAQRLRFADQRVTTPGALPITDRVSDLLAGASISWTPQWAFDATVQYNQKIRQSERASIGVRYNPTPYRAISAAFRRQRNVSEQIDVGWQWPVNDLWGDKGLDLGEGRGQGGGRLYSVGRLNYSTIDKKLVDSVIGFEYDGCCWIARLVLQRSSNSISNSNTRILFQLELVGFSRIGANTLQTLKSNVPRYQYLREKIEAPSRFTTYE